MKNSADQGGCYPQRVKAKVDNTLRDGQNSSYPTKAEFNNCFIIHSNISPLLKEFRHFALCFYALQNNTTLSLGFLSQRFNNLQRAALLTSFLTSSDQFSAGCTFVVIGSIFGQQQLVVVNYRCGFNQSETEKYFE